MPDPQVNPAAIHTPIVIDQGEVRLIHPIIEDVSDDTYTQLANQLDWREDSIKFGGKMLKIPRLQAWYGQEHCCYTYSGLTLQPQPFPAILDTLRHLAESIAGAPFNCALCNWYRHGQDSVGWHSDDEPELGRNPTIASYSFGATRRFLIKPKKGKHRATAIPLPHNSLLIMQGEMQHHWQHQLPKTQQPVGGRINLTFRYIAPATSA